MDENFRYKTINHSLHFIVKQLKSGKLLVHPDFTSEKSLRPRAKSQFIESLILSIPTQPIWCEETPHGGYVVIDGSERLQALLDFYENDFPLEGLKVKRHYEGLSFDQLPFHETINLIDRYNFSFIIINYDNPPLLKCEFYRELFRDKLNFSAQSARNFAYPRALEVLRWLRENSHRYINMIDALSHWSPPLENDPRVDEFFLYMLVFLMLHDTPYGIDRPISDLLVEDLLDSAMEIIDKDEKYATELSNILLTTLARIKSRTGEILKLVIGKHHNTRSTHTEAITLRHFFDMFIEMRIDKNFYSGNRIKSKPFIFEPNSPAHNLSHFVLGRNK
jgi:hypothetical protein